VRDCPWLPPISFGAKPYLALCRSFDQALKDLETKYPSHRRLLTIEARAKRLKKRRRPK
jgi:hypothetical protein